MKGGGRGRKGGREKGEEIGGRRKGKGEGERGRKGEGKGERGRKGEDYSSFVFIYLRSAVRPSQSDIMWEGAVLMATGA